MRQARTMQEKLEPLSGSALNRRRFLELAGVTVGGVSLFGVSACGGEESGEAGPGGAYQGQQAVAHLDEIIAAAPFHIAEKQGYFEDESLELKSVSFPGGADVVRAIQSQMNFGMPATLPTLIAYEKGVTNLRIISGAFNAPQVLFLVPADSPIQSQGDLRGKKLGVSEPSSITTYFAGEIARRNRLRPGEDIEIVSVGGPADAKTAADQGVVDVAWSTPPFSTQLIDSGEFRLLVDTADLEPQWADNTYVSTQEFIDSNSEVLRNWLSALGRAHDLIRNDTEKAGRSWASAVNLEPAVTTQALRDYREAFSLAIDAEGIEANVKAGQEMGQLKGTPDLDELVDDQLIPARYQA